MAWTQIIGSLSSAFALVHSYAGGSDIDYTIIVSGFGTDSINPLRGKAEEVCHDHAVLWILWRSHEAFRKVFVMIIGRKINLSTFEVALDGKAAI